MIPGGGRWGWFGYSTVGLEALPGTHSPSVIALWTRPTLAPTARAILRTPSPCCRSERRPRPFRSHKGGNGSARPDVATAGWLPAIRNQVVLVRLRPRGREYSGGPLGASGRNGSIGVLDRLALEGRDVR